MHRYIALVLLVAVAASLQQSKEMVSVAAPAISKPTAWKRIEWGAQVRASAHADKAHCRPLALSAASPPLVAGTLEAEDGTQMQILVCGARGEKGRRLVAGRDVDISSLQWSLDGTHLAYSSSRSRAAREPADPAETSQLWVVDVAQLKKWLVGERAQFPQWNPDGSEVFFWRPESAATVDSGAKWRLYKASAPWDRPAVTVASDVTLGNPVDISTDAKQLAYWLWDHTGGSDDPNVLVIQSLDTGTDARYPLLEGTSRYGPRSNCESVQWSGDSRRLLLALQPIDSVPQYYLFDTTTRRFVHLNPRVADFLRGASDDIKETEQIEITASAWAGRTANRILLVTRPFEYAGDVRLSDNAFPQQVRWKWVAYDATSEQLELVTLEPQVRRPSAFGEDRMHMLGAAVGPRAMTISPDGCYMVLAGDDVFSTDGQ